MTIDIGLRLARGRAAQNRNLIGEAAAPRVRLAWPWLIAGLAVCAVMLGLRWALPFNVDVSWWLIVGERVFDGQRLYLDILETNPPMAGSIYFLGVALARATGLRPEAVTIALMLALMTASLGLTWWLLRDSKLPGRPAAGALAVWAVALLGILPMYDFGQREHLALLFLMPALAVLIRRAGNEPVSTVAIVIAGVSAAVTMSFKPYFALGVGAAILAATLQARQWRILVAPENWIAGVLVVAYAAWIYVSFPAYFTLIYPVVRDVYLLLAAPWLALALSGATMLWLAAVFAVLLLQRRHKPDAAVTVLLATSFGFAVAFFVQRKGWGYHAYPMVALSMMALGYAVAVVDPATARVRIAASLAAVAILASACVWFNASVDIRKLEAAVAKLGPHPKIMMLGGAATIAHPLVRDVGGIWVSRQEAFLIREIVRRARQEQSFDAVTSARLDRHVATERDGLVADFRASSPDVVLVDNRDSDWGAWAQADPELAQLLKPYALVQTIDGIDILTRMP